MNFLIIGGNATGMSAASKLRKNMPDATITVIEKGDLVSFGACGLPYYVGDEFQDSNNMIARSLENFQKSNIDVLLHHEAITLDHQNQKVSIMNTQTSSPLELSYDKLLISTGAFPFVPSIEGLELKGIYTFTKMQDGIALKQALAHAQKIVIVGGGFIGIETAEALIHQRKTVTIIEKSNRVTAAAFDPEMTDHLETSLREHKVNLRLEETVTAFKGTDHVQQVITDKGTYNADLVIISVGFVPSTKWCIGSGILTIHNGAIIIDEMGKTNLPNVYAGGDCATVKNATFGQDSYIPLATSANKLGRILGDILADKKNSFQGTLGSSAIRFMDFEMGRTGLSEHEVQKFNVDYATNTIKDFDHTNYIPGQTLLFIKLIYDKNSRILLGGQICGNKGAVLRVDSLAIAIFKKMTVEELGMMDFVYCPPFSRTWDILNIAGNTSK